MSDKKLPYLINEDLTPQNALDKGYNFVGDVVNPYKAIQEILELVEKEGYIFGLPKKINVPTRVGLYRKRK